MKQQPQLNALIGIRPGQGGNAPLTPEHKRFQALLQKIDKARERLAQWNQQMPVFASAYALRVQPAVDALHARRRAWAFELEQILLSRKWAKADAQTISDIICDISEAQLGSLDDETNDDPEWQALLARHAEPEGPDATPEQIEELADAFERILGLDDEERYAAPNPRKHSSKTASAAARRAEEDARRISQTAREVYRKLAAALHPDRTPATASDEERRQRTDAMARANAAYEAGALLALLA